jgi:membrane fusion protein (multidrug efflux system)
MKASKTISIIAVIAVIAVAVYAVKTVKSGSTSGFSKGKTRTAQTTFAVKTETAAVKTLRDYVSASGDVEAQSSIQVFSDMGGKVVNVSVSLGSPVQKGQIIARIDPSEPGSKYALSPVTAPISGSIVTTPLKNGTKVTTSSVITTIGDVSNLQVNTDIPERYVALLKIGLQADVTLEAYPGVVFPASVSRISPVVNDTSRTKAIILTFNKHDDRINAGMFAKITLYTQEYSGAVTISGDAVQTKNGKTCAFVVTADNKAEQREIKLGNSVDGVYQILSGINAGEKVVIAGASTLSDGVTVKDITNGVPAVNTAAGTGSTAAGGKTTGSWSGKSGTSGKPGADGQSSGTNTRQ